GSGVGSAKNCKFIFGGIPVIPVFLIYLSFPPQSVHCPDHGIKITPRLFLRVYFSVAISQLFITKHYHYYNQHIIDSA
ncbi:hypothetical protein, partial [Hungatella hathewayi]|uniref:hypothetical protein n=1 Tax=Hungatella hathewayi TaxID=154046 RepID=UPI00356565A5